MLEKVCHIAAHVATSVSRREFLGKIGRGALLAASVLGGLLALPEDAEAASSRCCCHYFSGVLSCYRLPPGEQNCQWGHEPCNCKKFCSA